MVDWLVWFVKICLCWGEGAPELKCTQLACVESSAGAHDPGQQVPVLLLRRWLLPSSLRTRAGSLTPQLWPPPGALGSQAARELHAQATKAAFHDSVPSSNALNLPPRRLLVPSAALDQRPGPLQPQPWGPWEAEA